MAIAIIDVGFSGSGILCWYLPLRRERVWQADSTPFLILRRTSKDGKMIGHVHPVASADGKVLTVHNTGRQGNAPAADNTMVFDKQ
jgi:hypothetical protein